MSEPKPERLTEAKLAELLRTSERACADDQPQCIPQLVDEVRRLRGLIAAGVTAPTVEHWLSPLAGQGWVPGHAVQNLVAEAEAIRKEQG